MALGDIHRLTGHDQLFDTLLVYENYPIDPSAFMNVADLAVTDFTSREYNHYPLSFVASPGDEMALRVEFDTDVFTRAGIATLVDRFQHVLEVMAADPAQRLSGVDVLDESEHAQLDVWGNRAVLTGPAAELASIPALFAAQVARAPEAVAHLQRALEAPLRLRDFDAFTQIQNRCGEGSTDVGGDCTTLDLSDSSMFDEYDPTTVFGGGAAPAKATAAKKVHPAKAPATPAVPPAPAKPAARALAAPDEKSEEVKLEKFEVTGSRIKRLDTETPAPTVTITSEDIWLAAHIFLIC